MLRKKTLVTIAAVLCGVAMATITTASWRYMVELDGRLQTVYREASQLSEENADLEILVEEQARKIEELELAARNYRKRLQEAELSDDKRKADILEQELHGLRQKAQNYWNLEHNARGSISMNADEELRLYLDTLTHKYGKVS
jgi:predicted RNase H-like nuclease (RuvC/YqgF family)